MSTDFCLDATVKSGFEQRFHIIIPAYANSTYDNPYFDGETAYKYYNEFMWSVRYAQTVSVEETIEMKKGKSSEYKKKIFDCVHSGLVEAFGIEEWEQLSGSFTGAIGIFFGKGT